MAGIGFELKKVFTGRSIAETAYGYTCATVIVAGPTFLAILMLLGFQYISEANAGRDWNVILVMITYSMIGALLTSSILTHTNSRYAADALYQNDFGRVMPSINGSFAFLIIPFGILYALILSTAKEVLWYDKLLNFLDFVIITYVYLQLSYLTAVKKFKRLIIWFAIGIASALILAWIFIRWIKMSSMTSVFLAIFIGYGILFMGNSKELYEEFPTGYGSNLMFLGHVVKYPALAICSFFTMATSFTHIVIMWFGHYGTNVTGWFYCAPEYDSAAFYAFLVALPSTVLFVVFMEVNFYGKYRKYFDAVSLNGTLKDIDLTRDDMKRSLKNEVLRLEVVQFIFMLAYMFAMRFYLQTIGFTRTLLVIFYFLCVGYAAQGIANSLILVLLYFDNRRYAAIVAVSGFIVCTVVTLMSFNNVTLYGIGMTAAGIVMLIIAILLLELHLQSVDELVFCSQPIFSVDKRDSLTKLLQRYDKRTYRRTIRSKLHKEEIQTSGRIGHGDWSKLESKESSPEIITDVTELNKTEEKYNTDNKTSR